MKSKFELAGQLLINNQYLTINQIGKGGFGTVFRAWDFSLKNFIALKKLLPHCKESKFIEMFYKEALIAKNLIQENIVRIQHFWKGSDGEYYLVMDYLKGGDLAKILNRCKEKKVSIPWYIAIFICSEILKALDYGFRIAKEPAGEKPYGIIYRDISPDNILISFNGNIKLTDFGIAKTLDEISSETKQRIIAGKYRYMSPEQICGETDIDHKTDIFSTGVLLYELLTNTPLFSGDIDTIKQQILHFQYNFEQLQKLDIPSEVVRATIKALQKERDKRYKSVFDFFNDLRQTLRGIKTEQEIITELSELVRNILKDEFIFEQESNEWVKQLQLHSVCSSREVIKITCKDFIPDVVTEVVSDLSPPLLENLKVTPEDEKGKTIFEEVGNWLLKKYKRNIAILKRISIGVLTAIILFFIVDIFLPENITPIGSKIYSRIFPPTVIIYTIPVGVKVSVTDRTGKSILKETEVSGPIEIRKIPAGSYIFKATKDGYQPIEQIVSIEEKPTAKNPQVIALKFRLPVRVFSEPSCATVYIDGEMAGITPYQGEILAGEHTIQLSLLGFEPLGSLAKEEKNRTVQFQFNQEQDIKIFANV
ncbi:MAG: serine/threonine-protein kinase, partial [Elusimicrobiota bacterium]|nr:serine/threonine-protein kinase [Elusimicrobiota bacterium]